MAVESAAPPSACMVRTELGEDEGAFLEWLFREAGLELRNYRIKTIRRRIPACLRGLRAATFGEARQALLRKPSLLGGAISTLVIGVTSFFRDPAVFHHLRVGAIPQMVAGRFGLAIWSIGCSDGSEVYSLAMMLSEMKLLEQCHLLGTDCRSEAIRRAKLGVYEESAVRNVPQGLLSKYFFRREGRWHISPHLKSAVTWRRADVLSLHEPGVWDMILCRNMSMYFSPEASMGLWARLENSLRPGGALVLGKAERPSGARHLAMSGACVYRRRRA
jgi:chemotaxis methyl-accepting protein methylase